jgi:D-arabinose 1-dehydrogenase-like Zn-dependent alcohol dehydrogenase
LKTTHHDGCVAACGNVSGGELHTSVYPFILKGVTLYGVDSVGCSTDFRRLMWDRLANDWEIPVLPELYRTVSLSEVPEVLQNILKGKVKGRVVVEL